MNEASAGASRATYDALGAEAVLFDTFELAQMTDAADVGPAALEAMEEAVELLCRAYSRTPAAVLRDRTRRRLTYVTGLLQGRTSRTRQRDLLVHAGWLAALLGCLHYDLGERGPAEVARRGAYRLGRQAGHGELVGWAHEMSAWFALVEGRFDDAVTAARRGQEAAGAGSAMVQLALQEAKGHARLGDRGEAAAALERGATVLGRLPAPSHPENHFVFDHTKWFSHAATICVWQGDDDRAEEYAREIVRRHTRPDGTCDAPMRTADARIDLALVHARRGDLDAAVESGVSAFGHERKSLGDLVARGTELDRLLDAEYPGEPLTEEFHEHLLAARRALGEHRSGAG